MRSLSDFITFVEQNPITIEEVRKILKGDAPLVGDRNEYVIFLTHKFEACNIENFDFRLVMSIETSPSRSSNEKYKCRRMSICSRSGEYDITRIIELCYILGFNDSPDRWSFKFIEEPIHNMDITQLLEVIR